MRLLSGKEAARHLHHVISARHQVHAYSVDLTARKIYRLGPTGAVDFGGSEYLAAEPQALALFHKHPQDKYLWWTLMHGAHLIEFNESLSLDDAQIALLGPHERLLQTGVIQSSVFLRGQLDTLAAVVTVAAPSVQIKENARIGSLRVFQLDGAPPRRTVKAKVAKKPSKKKSARRKPAKKRKR